jgi:hypothetical protein
MVALLLASKHGSWAAVVFIPLVFVGMIGSLSLIVSGLRGILARRG